MRVCVTGHMGYVGTKLSEKLDNFVGLDWQDGKDMRNIRHVQESFIDCDAVIHLANISNDPSFDLAPGLAKSVNWDCFPMMVEQAAKAAVKRFIFASSSSVYGVKEIQNVTENIALEPLTEYSKYKVMCEDYLQKHCPKQMEYVIVRPATICGYSSSMRLDLLVNIFTHHAWQNGIINVHGGAQYRPNIHIDDIVDAYICLLAAPDVDGEIFNCGYQNLTLLETAEMVRSIVGSHVQINIEESKDLRSYHVNSDKIKSIFTPKRTIEDAIEDIVEAFENGKISDLDNDKYYRVRQMKAMA